MATTTNDVITWADLPVEQRVKVQGWADHAISGACARLIHAKALEPSDKWHELCDESIASLTACMDIINDINCHTRPVSQSLRSVLQSFS